MNHLLLCLIVVLAAFKSTYAYNTIDTHTFNSEMAMNRRLQNIEQRLGYLEVAVSKLTEFQKANAPPTTTTPAPPVPEDVDVTTAVVKLGKNSVVPKNQEINGEKPKEKVFYFYTHDRVKNNGANEICKKTGKQLAEILSEEENNAILKTLKSKFSGLPDYSAFRTSGKNTQGNEYTWLTSGQKFGFTYWSKNARFVAGSYYCVDFLKEKSEGWAWEPSKCKYLSSALCQKYNY